MANYERDKDNARVYDGSEDDEDGEGSHLPVVIIIAILVLAAFGGVVWLAYNQGVARGRTEPVRVASTESTDPGNGGQIKVYQQPAGAEDEDDTQTVTGKPANSPPPQAVARNEVPPQKATPPQQTVTQTPAAPKPQAQTPAAKPPVAQVTPPKPAQVAQATPKPQPPAVATKPPAQLGIAHPATETPKPVATAAPATPKPVATATPPKPAAVKPAAVKPVAGGSYLLQIGAYKSEADAMAAWKAYSSKHAALLAGFAPDVQKADLGEKGTWYRLRIASFPDKNGAMALCDRLKAQNGACFLAH